MTEKEKMIAGQLYDASDSELSVGRTKARNLIVEYNQLTPSENERRNAILAELLGSSKSSCCIELRFFCDYGYNIHVGENFFANAGCTILDCAEVRIGDNVLLAPNVGIYTATHPTDAKERLAGLEYALPITIGNNVWVGADVTILPGVTIGDNAVIGAGSVVVKSIPANVVAVGNPCQVIRELL